MSKSAEGSPIKTALKTQLFAGEVLVAESDDAMLWQRVMSAITNDEPLEASRRAQPAGADPKVAAGGSGETNAPSDPVAAMARDIGVSREELRGALDPQDHEPFVHLDIRSWEAYRRNFPKRGAGAVPRITMAATALVLWFRHAGLGNPTQAQAQEALNAIGDPDPNPSRSIKNCDWIQSRADGMTLNPAKASMARAVVRAFCQETAPGSSR